MSIYSILGNLTPVFMFRALADHYARQKNNKALQFMYDVADHAHAEKSEVLLLNHYCAVRWARIEERIINDT